MKNKIKFIYFDVGGVLVHWRSIFDHLSKRTGKTVEEVEKIYFQYDEIACRGLMTPEVMSNRLTKDFGLKDNQRLNVRQLARDYFRPIIETHDFISRIINHLPVGLLTNIYHGIYDLSVKGGHIPDLSYKVVIQSCRLGIIKPEKEIFHHAQKKAGVPHENILFIDDYEVNIKSAGELGWQVVHFDSQNPQKSLKEITRLLNLSMTK